MPQQSAAAMKPVKGSVPVKGTSPTSIFERIEDIYDSITRRAFEIFEGDGWGPGRALEHWLRAESERLHPLHLELAEPDHDMTVRAEAPGFTTKEIEINVEPRRLTITAKRESKEEGKKGKTVYSEFCANEILRVVELPVEVDTSKVNAILKDGILNIELPKAASAKTVRVEAKAAN